MRVNNVIKEVVTTELNIKESKEYFSDTGDKGDHSSQQEKYFKDMDWNKQTDFGNTESPVPNRRSKRRQER